MRNSGKPSDDIRSAAPVDGISRAEFLRLFGGLSVFAATATFSGGRFAAALAAAGGTLTVGISSDIKTLDPQMSTLDVFRHTIRSTVFESLVYINPETLKADPMLAESWEMSADGLSLTFKLRDGVTWSDGGPVDAADFKFTYDAIASDLVETPRKSNVEQIVALLAVSGGVLDGLPLRELRDHVYQLVRRCRAAEPGLCEELDAGSTPREDWQSVLVAVLTDR